MQLFQPKISENKVNTSYRKYRVYITENISSDSSKVQTTIETSIIHEETLKAETIFPLNCLKNCCSNSSVNEINNIFSTMFLGSKIGGTSKMRQCKITHND